jgi:eukaryotic-like serine/threonine-protein kinase
VTDVFANTPRSTLNMLLPFGSDYQIRLDQPLLDYSRAWAPCFEARHVDHPDMPLMAYICAPTPGVRIEMARRSQPIDRAGLLKLLHHDALPLPGKPDHYGFVYEQPIAPAPPRRLWGAYNAKLLTANLIRPAIAALGALFDVGQAHGSIRPDNLFSMDTKQSLFTLGPATLCPPGYDQPAVFETIERALAKRESKGSPGPADDMFALGLTIYALASGKMPGEGVDDAEIIQRRLRYSSQAALLDTASMPRDMVDMIVGLTEDDVRQRWDLQKLGLWASGRRPDQTQRPNLGRRRMTFMVGGVECDTAREIAQVLFSNQTEGMRLVRDGAIDKWIADNATAGSAPAAAPTAATLKRRSSSDDAPDASVELSRAIMRLDPSGPIRYKSLSFFPAGAGHLLQQIINDPPRRQEFCELLGAKLVTQWMRTAAAFGLVDIETKRLQDIEKSYERFGDTLEAALYKLNPDAPCLSPAVAGKWARSHIDLAEPIEAACSDPQAPKLDRHMIGFFGARAAISDRAIQHWHKLNQPTKMAAPSVLRVAGRFQEDCDGKAFPNLAKVCLRMADTVIEDIHHPETREKLRAQIVQKASSGDVSEMFDLVMDEGVRAADARAFAEAKQEFDSLDAALSDREGLLARAKRMGRDRGLEAAYGLLSIACMGGLIVMMFVELSAR